MNGMSLFTRYRENVAKYYIGETGRVIVNRIRNMVGFELRNRDRCVFVLSRAWNKEKILSPHEESNLRPSNSALRCVS